MNDELSGTDGLVGASPHLMRIRDHVRHLAESNCHVLITGESGTGKEVVAQMIHRNSRRFHRPMVSLNCAAIQESLLETEFFGRERGAYTSADRSSIGKVELADGGVIFLDEIGHLPLSAQAKLLRVLDTQDFYPVGSNRLVRVDVRILAATNGDIENLVEEEKFRGDLYYRLNVGRIELPPLRERSGDIMLLAEHFLNEHCRREGLPAPSFSREVREAFENYRWPGNVREVRNVIEAAMVRRPWPSIESVHLQDSFIKKHCQFEQNHERDRILAAIGQAGENRALAADNLGWSRAKLYRKLCEHKIEHRAKRQRAS
jgi:transcriptional regulator with GAF, ATPase, and Fis domain